MMSAELLKRPLSDCHFVAIDFETTGLSAVRDRAVELGLLRFGLDQSLWAPWSSLFQPGVQIPAEVTAIHGLRDADVASAPTFAAQAETILSQLQDAVLLAHHAPFDLAFLSWELRRAGYALPALPVIDTFQLARQILRAPSFKLTELLQWLEQPPPVPAHRALPDAMGCARLLLACLQRRPELQSLTLEALFERLPQIRMGTLGTAETASAEQDALQQAIMGQQDVQIEYHNARQQTLLRQITPLLLGGYGSYAYVEAYCHLRQEHRQFRLNRIQKVALVA
ncbi:MAG: WYL domain-containing protein [Candidatus Sericytochromatia bacterium]|nr:WYL domain-containing protein [Candidatus Sericytochromatia bacterium]